MTSIQDPEDPEAYEKMRAERDKLKEELERQIRFVREATDERDEARADVSAWKLAAILGSVGDIPIGSSADEAKRIACQSADALKAELSNEKGQHGITQEKRKEFEGYADRLRAELDGMIARRGKEAQQIGKLFQSIGGFGVDEKDPVGALIAFAAEWQRRWQESEADVAALKKRKVKLPAKRPDLGYTRQGAMNDEYNSALQDCVDAIRAAGVEIEGEGT